MNRTLKLLALSAVVAGSAVLHAEDLYVRAGVSGGARTGADWNNAWSGFSDIKWGEGAGRLGAGDTLWVAGGTYTSPLVLGASGVAGSPLRVKRVLATDAVPVAAAGWSPSFDGQVAVTTGGACIYFVNAVGSYVEVDGRVRSGIRVNYANGGSGVEIDGSGNFTDILLRGIEAAGPGPIVQSGDTRGFDLTIAGMLTNITMSLCEAHHSDTLVQVTQSRNLVIEYSDFHHAGAINAATYHPNTIYLGTAVNATIRYNTLREIDVEGLFIGDPGCDGVAIYGNLFYQGSSAPNSGRGIEFDNSASSRNVVVMNNTFVNLPLAGVNFANGQSHPGAVVRNNLFFNCGANYGPAAHDYNWYSGSNNYGEPNGIASTASPFVNAAAYDYRIVATLASNLPKDRGVNLGAPFNVDRDGNVRGADGFWDIGAYESAGGGSGAVNTAPTIGSVANQTVTSGGTVGPISFAVSDAQTASSLLVVTGTSNNPTLLPASGLVLGGSGSSRTVTLTPAAGQTGTAIVTLTVSDGTLTAVTSFTLTVSGVVTPPPPPPSTGSGLVAAYGFNEGAGSTAADASGNGLTGTLQGATWTSAGRYGGALSFNGTNSLVTIASAAPLALGSAMTIEAWVRPAAALSGWRTIVQKEVDTYFLHASSSGAMRPAGGGTFNTTTSFATAPSAIAANSWTHLAVTYDGAMVRLYVNGALVASQAQTGAMPSTTTPLRIGGNAPYGEFFQGLIDDVRIYNRALTAAEIQLDLATPVAPVAPPPPANVAPTLSAVSDQLTLIGTAVGPLAFTVADADTALTSVTVSVASDNATLFPAGSAVLGGSGANRTLTATPAAGQSGVATLTLTANDGQATATEKVVVVVHAPPTRNLIAAYGFDEGSGLVANDVSGFGHHGELRGATWSSTGKFGGALNFNGTSAFVYVKPTAVLNPGGAMTLEAWVRPAATQSGWRTIVQKEVDNYFLHASSSGALRPAMGGTFGTTKTMVAGTSALPVGAWSHLASTYDGATARLYVNGVLVASKAQTGAIQASNNALRIGGNVPYGEFFRGLIDEVRLYNRALAVTEIQADMAAPLATIATAWAQTDVGTPGLAGTLATDPVAGTVTVGGSGAGIGGTGDSFRFVYRALRGDGVIDARVASLTGPAGAKAGVMIRGTLGADAVNVFAGVTPTATVVQVRSAAGGATTTVPAAAVKWVRVVRAGTSVVGMVSPDGIQWTVTTVATLPLNTEVFAGLAVTAGDVTQRATAVFAEPLLE